MATWFFQKHDGYGDIDQSSASEAFSGTSISDLATALVREGVQNIIDARSNRADVGRLRLRLTLGTCTRSARDLNNRWFGELMHHLQQSDVGAPDAPQNGEACTYLAFEDFGTRGLVGDYAAPYTPGEENNFVNFMYHDGVSGKSDAKLGSRGVGKIVFTMASRARTIFAYTIPETNPGQPLLVGKNLLKFRKIGQELYAARSYFLEAWPPSQPRQPVRDPVTLEQFRMDFPITRSTEPGLSIIIPFLDPSVDMDQLRRAIVEEYHVALLAGELAVELSNGSVTEVISEDNLPDINDDDVNARVALARWAASHTVPQIQTLPPEPNQVQRLTEQLVPVDVKAEVANALGHRERIALRVPLHIHPRNAEPVLTHFDVYLEFAERHHAKPEFVRDLLPVSDVREARSAPQVRALVLVRDRPLADLLRAAEGANHTDWSPRTDRFQERYVGRRGEISFVAQSVSKIVEIARGQANEPVGGIATQFFSAARPQANATATDRGRNRRGADPEQPPEELPPTPPAGYVLTQHDEGFAIRHNPGQPLPSRLTVRVAYDVLRGSPWSDYDPADFDFRKTRVDVRVLASDAAVERKEPGNRLVIVPESEAFEVVATGFDPNRDLIVDVRDTERSRRKQKEDSSADQANELHQPQTADA
jgi:hypothetical protein